MIFVAPYLIYSNAAQFEPHGVLIVVMIVMMVVDMFSIFQLELELLARVDFHFLEFVYPTFIPRAPVPP